MAIADLQGPIDDFLARTKQIREIVVAIESAAKLPTILTTNRAGINLADIGFQTGNTVNAMSLVFLASSFEEFVREEIGQCAGYMVERYAFFKDDDRHSIRNAYWSASLARLKFNGSILTKKKPKILDPLAVGKIRLLIDSVRGFVIDDDAIHIEKDIFSQHSNNFRPHIVDEIASRIGIAAFIDSAGDSGRLKSYFGVTTKIDVAKKLRSKLDEFYDRRNETVHSLGGSTGYAVDVILDYINLFEMTAESMKNVLGKAIASW